MNVTLERITDKTVRAVTKLAVGPGQTGFVAPNAVSLAQALFSDEAWYRAIHADGELVGFVMLADETQRPEPPPTPRVFLWRYMIDAAHQRRGIGREALRLVLDHVRTRPGVAALHTSYVPGDGSPGPFYEGLGFTATGDVEDGEIVLVIPLTPGDTAAVTRSFLPNGTETARPFLPARDFEASKRFYETIGFAKLLEGEVAIFEVGRAGFVLQRHWQKEWAENTMLQLMVDDLDAWWAHLEKLDLPAKFGVPAPKPPAMQPWGLRVAYLVDPAGVLWHVAERRPGAVQD